MDYQLIYLIKNSLYQLIRPWLLKLIYCIKMLLDLFNSNRFGIFAHWYIYSWNNNIVDVEEDLILGKIFKFFKLFKMRLDILCAEAQLKYILEN